MRKYAMIQMLSEKMINEEPLWKTMVAQMLVARARNDGYVVDGEQIKIVEIQMLVSLDDAAPPGYRWLRVEAPIRGRTS